MMPRHFTSRFVAVAHEAGAVVVAVAPDEDAADAGDDIEDVAAADVAAVDDGLHTGGGKEIDGGGNRVCPSVGITDDPQHVGLGSGKDRVGHSRCDFGKCERSGIGLSDVDACWEEASAEADPAAWHSPGKMQ
jgi:hypothetical protein